MFKILLRFRPTSTSDLAPSLRLRKDTAPAQIFCGEGDYRRGLQSSHVRLIFLPSIVAPKLTISLMFFNSPVTTLPGGPVDKPVKAAAKRLGATEDQILLAWAKAKGAVVLTSSSKKSRLEGYIKAGDLGTLCCFGVSFA